MRLIDRAPSLTFSYRRADVAAFWVVLVSAWSLMIAGAAGLLAVHQAWVYTAGGALAIVVPGLFRAGWFEGGITIWNDMVRTLSSGLRRYALVVSYRLLFAATSKTGAAAVPPAGSRWIRLEAGDRRGAGQDLQTWWRSTATIQRVFLLPAIVLLLLLQEEQPDAVPSGTTYTLY